MKCRLVPLAVSSLSVISLLYFITLVYKSPAAPHPTRGNLAATPSPTVRRSANLSDGVYTYHLDYSRFQSEFPYLQTYECSLNLTPRGQFENRTGQPLLILAIKSHPASSGRREALRRTWAREGVVGGYRVSPIFLMGHGGSPGHMELVKVESQAFGDILQWDFIEGHHNLSLKERCFLEWLHHNAPWVAFVFKGDDDVYANPSRIVQYIEERGSSPAVLHGALQRHAAVMRSSKYRVSYTLFQSSKYPFFLSGGGFLYPGAAAARLYKATLRMPVFPLDDVYMGFLALAANLTLRHDSGFCVFGLAYDACRYRRALLVHGVSPEHLLAIWSEVQASRCDGSAARGAPLRTP